jgi:hypothetical protein
VIRPVDCKANISNRHPGARPPRDPGVKRRIRRFNLAAVELITICVTGQATVRRVALTRAVGRLSPALESLMEQRPSG